MKDRQAGSWIQTAEGLIPNHNDEAMRARYNLDAADQAAEAVQDVAAASGKTRKKPAAADTKEVSDAQ